jgi:putative alpha-1,2-mannosidase
MAKAVADTDSDSNQGGFTLDGSSITGFSCMHDSGTGGLPSLGNFALFPWKGCEDDDINGCMYPKRSRKTGYVNSSVNASPGYFSLTMNSNIDIDMTVAQHTSLFRFRFPTTGHNVTGQQSSPLILLDLTDLPDSRQDNATVTVDSSSGRMTGGGRFLPSFGSGSYSIYFCADFKSSSRLRDSGIYVDSRASSDVKNLKISRSINGYPLPVSITLSASEGPLSFLIFPCRVVPSSDSILRRTILFWPELASVSSTVPRHVQMPNRKFQSSTSNPLIQQPSIFGKRNSVQSECPQKG